MQYTSRYRAYIAYKIVSDELFKPVIAPDWKRLETWTQSDKANELKRLRSLYFRNKLCLERRLRYKFTYVDSSHWDDGHEKAIDEAKSKVKVYLALLEEFETRNRAINVGQDLAKSFIHEDDQPPHQASRKVQTSRRRKRKCDKGLNTKSSHAEQTIEEDFLEFKRTADEEGARIFDGMYSRIVTLIEEHTPRALSALELDALTSTIISMIPCDIPRLDATWRERALNAQRHMEKLSDTALENIVVSTLHTYGPTIAKLSAEPEPPASLKVYCNDPSCPPALVPLMRRASLTPLPIRIVTASDLRPDVSFSIFADMLVINSVAHGCGKVLGDYQLVDRATTWVTIQNVRAIRAATTMSDLIGRTAIFDPDDLYGPKAEAMAVLMGGLERMRKDVETSGESESFYALAATEDFSTTLRCFRKCLGQQLNHPAAHYKVIYLLLNKKLKLHDAVLRPRHFLRTWFFSKSCFEDRQFDCLQMAFITYCLYNGVGGNLLDIATYYLQLEKWDQSLRSGLEKALLTKRVPTEWRQEIAQAKDSALFAETFEEFNARFDKCDLGREQNALISRNGKAKFKEV